MSFKPVNYMRNRGTFAGLVRLDIDTGEISNILRLPSAAFRDRYAFMVPNAQALAVDGSIAYVGLWNCVVVVDLKSFSVIDAFSSPEMADVHSIAVSDEHVFIVSTATECVLCVDKSSFRIEWRWGPNEPILSYGHHGLLPGFRSRVYRAVIRRLGLLAYLRIPKYRTEETRFVHKTVSPYYRHHMNNVFFYENQLFLNTKGWFDTKTSSVIRLNLATMESDFFVKPGGFIGSHDGIFHDGWYYVTEADNNSLARSDCSGKRIERFPLQPEGYFIRGLARVDGFWFIGFTPQRGSTDPALIGVYEAQSLQRECLVRVPDLYGPGESVAIHTIVQGNI
jgi:hypothetical protein